MFVQRVKAFDESQLPKIQKWLDDCGNMSPNSPDFKQSLAETDNFSRRASLVSGGNDESSNNKHETVQNQIEKLNTSVMIEKS